MKATFTKTTILSLCVILGLTIGISSAFGQKLADQSKVTGEVPIGPTDEIQKQQIVPEHLKPQEQAPKENETPPQIRGEKPINEEKIEQGQKRLVPENQTPPQADTKSTEEQAKPQDNQQNTEKEEEKPEPSPPEQEKEKPESSEDSREEKSTSEPKQKEETSQEQNQENAPEPEESESKEESASDDQKQTSIDQDQPKTKSQDSSTDSTQQQEGKTEIEIPQLQVENTEGETIDVTSVIEDIFGEVNSAKEETEETQKQMEDHVALNEESKPEKPSQEKDLVMEEIDENNPPRTVQNGKMPMTASNDLQDVLIGLLIAIVGIFFVLFRKGEQK